MLDRIRKKEEGSVMVESAISLFLWLLTFLMFVDCCLLVTSYYSVNQAARQVAQELTIIPLPIGFNETVPVNLSGPPPVCDMKEITSDPEGKANATCKVRNVFYSVVRGKALFLDSPLTGSVTLPNNRQLTVSLTGRFRGLFGFAYVVNMPVIGNNDVEYIWPPYEL